MSEKTEIAETTGTIEFVEINSRLFVPVLVEGESRLALVKNGSLRGHDVLGGPGSLAEVTTNDERATEKAWSRLNTGRWVAAYQPPKAGITAKHLGHPVVPKKDLAELLAAREARQAELEAESAIRKEATKAAREAAKAEKAQAAAAESPRKPRKPRKGKTSGSTPTEGSNVARAAAILIAAGETEAALRLLGTV